VVEPFEDFCTLKGVERWVAFTLTSYVKGHKKKKQAESGGPI
jgi:hypothetical protein